MALTVALIPQDKSNACWLASAAMMRSWKDQQSYSLADTLSFLDPSGNTMAPTYQADNPLPFTVMSAIVQALNLTALPPASYTIDFFTSTLAVSPIFAIIYSGAAGNVSHAVVLTGISGDQTSAGTNLQVNDPWPVNTGASYSITFSDFLAKFEQVVALEAGDSTQGLVSQLYYFGS